MTESDELYAERDRVVRELGRSKAPLSEAALPHSPGIYALWATAESSLGGLGLEDVPGEETLMTRPLYVGKDTSSLMKRLDKHFKPGDTGHSTVRRTPPPMILVWACSDDHYAARSWFDTSTLLPGIQMTG